MTQVIIYQNPNALNVCVCVPTGDVPIQNVLATCPAGAQIVDNSTLPQGDDFTLFFDAWRLNGSTITIDIVAAQADYLAIYNSNAVSSGQIRTNNTYAGIANVPNDATWISAVNAGRTSIASATTTAELVAIPLPTPTTGA
jgi:hypothetical protein